MIHSKLAIHQLICCRFHCIQKERRISLWMFWAPFPVQVTERNNAAGIANVWAQLQTFCNRSFDPTEAIHVHEKDNVFPSHCPFHFFISAPHFLCCFVPFQSSFDAISLLLDNRRSIFFVVVVAAEVACRGERVRDVYQRQQGYAACQTQEKVSRLECRGSCPGGAEGQGTCCTPLRSKRRKYTFQCTDGSSFVQEVEKIVKCGCTKCST